MKRANSTQDLSDTKFYFARGRVEDASYRDLNLPDYSGNPLIEALPSLWNEEELIYLLTKNRFPDSTSDKLSPHERRHLLENVKRFYQPLSISVEIALEIGVMLRAGYQDRDPLKRDFRSKLMNTIESFKAQVDEFDDDGITTSSMTIIGLSGMGKTRTIKRILATYPQVINHSQYKSRNFNQRQLVWIMLQCPRNGSIGGLCRSFFRVVDAILGTNTYEIYVLSKGTNIDTLILDMATVAANQFLGFLVIDEIQNLHGAAEGKQFLNFLVQFSNDFKIPLILIGTPRAEGVLTDAFRQARRGTGYGNFIWQRLKPKKKADDEDGDWEIFLATLWKYQYLKQQTPLSKRLENALYEVSGGIVDLAIKIFIAAQKRAMYQEKEIKALTPALIRSVAKDEFVWVSEAVAALRLGTDAALRKYEDLYFRNVKTTGDKQSLRDSISTKDVVGSDNGSGESSAQSQSLVWQQEADKPELNITEISLEASTKHASTKKNDRKNMEKPKGALAEAIHDGKSRGLNAYQSLNATGFLRSVEEFFPKD